MACQVRVLYPLVLGALVMCLLMYSSFNVTSGVFQSTAPGTTLSFNKDRRSHVSRREAHTVIGLLLSFSVQWYIKSLKAGWLFMCHYI